MADVYHVYGKLFNDEPIEIRVEFEQSAETLAKILRDSPLVKDVKYVQRH